MTRTIRIRYTIRTLLLLMLVGALVAWYYRARYLDTSYFPMAVGDRWVYASSGDTTDDVIFEVVGTQKVDGAPCFVVERVIGAHKISFYISIQQDGIRLHRVGDDVYLPPYRQFAFPTKEKDPWDWKGTIGGTPGDYHCHNMGQSDITVPHGQHKAFVVMQGSSSQGWATFALVRGVGVVQVDGKFADQHDPQGRGVYQQFHWKLKQFTRK